MQQATKSKRMRLFLPTEWSCTIEITL